MALERLPHLGARGGVSQSLTVLSLLLEAMIFPSGLKATEITAPLWPLRGSPTWAPEEASQSLTVLSLLLEAMIFPSGLKVTEVTPLMWPSRGSPTWAPEEASQSLTVST
jgi:hypothetical protein